MIVLMRRGRNKMASIGQKLLPRGIEMVCAALETEAKCNIAGGHTPPPLTGERNK